MCIFLLRIFCYQAPNILGGHSGQFSIHLSHQDSVNKTYKISRDMRIGWCHLSTIPGTIPGSTPHCLVSTEGDINFRD